MLELWLKKTKETEVVRDHRKVVEPSGGIGYKKILINNLNPKKIRNIEAIMKDIMNLDVTDYESDEDFENKDLENCVNSTKHEY